MANDDWTPGEVLSRKVGASIEELLPANLATADNVRFSARGPLDRETLPGQAVAGDLAITGTVGEDSQFAVELDLSMQKRSSDGGDPVDWTVSTWWYRVEDRGPADLDPFHYHAEWEERVGETTAADSGVIDLADVREHYQFARSEGVAALLLTEIIANRRASAEPTRGDRISHAGSLAMLGSFNTALVNGRIGVPGWTLDWETVADLLGPDAETIASRASIETTVPERKRRATEKGLNFLADESAGGDREPGTVGPGDKLQSLLEEIGGTESADVPAVDLATGDPEATQKQLKDRLLDYPDGFPGALDDGNFGVARDLADGWETPYEKMVLIYAFHELYAAVVQLRAAEEAVRDIAAAITAFRTAIERGDTEMAQLSLKRASDAFVTVTRELVNGAQSRLEALDGLVAYHDMSATFDRQVAKRSDLSGADLEYYRSATEALVEAARRQHARSEQAREAYHLYTESG